MNTHLQGRWLPQPGSLQDGQGRRAHNTQGIWLAQHERLAAHAQMNHERRALLPLVIALVADGPPLVEIASGRGLALVRFNGAGHAGFLEDVFRIPPQHDEREPWGAKEVEFFGAVDEEEGVPP